MTSTVVMMDVIVEVAVKELEVELDSEDNWPGSSLVVVIAEVAVLAVELVLLVDMLDEVLTEVAELASRSDKTPVVTLLLVDREVLSVLVDAIKVVPFELVNDEI